LGKKNIFLKILNVLFIFFNKKRTKNKKLLKRRENLLKNGPKILFSKGAENFITI
jgi:hypothetical protein